MPGLELGVTPIFYFYKDGKLRYKVEGWPSSERKSELFQGLRRIGVLPPTPR